MRKYLLAASLLFAAGVLVAQKRDTVRSKINYRTNSYEQNSQSSSTSELKNFNQYVGLEANQLLRQIFDFSNDNSSSGNPYLITYSFNSSNTGSGMSFGLGYLSRKLEDVDQGQKRATKTSDIRFRMGYEKKSKFGKRWLLGLGIDFLLMHGVDETSVDNGGIDFNSKTNGWGFGPRLSVLFEATENILIGTEMAWYFQRDKTTADFPSLPQSNSDLIDRSFNLQPPTALFLTLRF